MRSRVAEMQVMAHAENRYSPGFSKLQMASTDDLLRVVPRWQTRKMLIGTNGFKSGVNLTRWAVVVLSTLNDGALRLANKISAL